MIKSIFLLFISLLFCFQLNAQTDDNIVWAYTKVIKKLDTKTSLALAPIVRIDNDISDFQNWSLDYSIRHKFAKNWAIQVLGRTWFIPNQKGRQFVWLDLIYSKKIKNIKASSRVRWHNALDINDRKDPDFIRWKTGVALKKLGKFTPQVAIEPWWRLNGAKEFQRIRYEPGFTLDIAKSLKFGFVFRREESLNLDPDLNVNQFVVGISYVMP